VRLEGRSYLEVSVADTGPGIPKELQDRVFNPFFTTERGGTGLGLAIAKRIITAHKGIIRLTSFPGGTIFHVQLPQDEK
jgi:signal transduction histidine kinase